jgi:hypothetical protein
MDMSRYIDRAKVTFYDMTDMGASLREATTATYRQLRATFFWFPLAEGEAMAREVMDAILAETHLTSTPVMVVTR